MRNYIVPLPHKPLVFNSKLMLSVHTTAFCPTLYKRLIFYVKCVPILNCSFLFSFANYFSFGVFKILNNTCNLFVHKSLFYIFFLLFVAIFGCLCEATLIISTFNFGNNKMSSVLFKPKYQQLIVCNSRNF